MVDPRPLTDRFAVAHQLTKDDFAVLKRLGFTRIINNRPDGEEGGQLSSAEAKAAAQAAGLEYVVAPFTGKPTPEAVEAAKTALGDAAGKTLAHCRSGTRSSHAWAMAEALRGQLTPDEIIEKAAGQGYNLSAMKDLLRNLAAR